MSQQNFLNRVVSRINRMPSQVRSRALTAVFGRAVKFAGTARVRVKSINDHEAVLELRNRPRVQNHIGSVHAAAMALLAESATGFLVGMNVPDSRIPVIKTLHVDYVKRASGQLRAVASLSDEQIQQIRTLEKGEVTVPVVITDERGVEPVECRMVWAWTPKVRR